MQNHLKLDNYWLYSSYILDIVQFFLYDKRLYNLSKWLHKYKDYLYDSTSILIGIPLLSFLLPPICFLNRFLENKMLKFLHKSSQQQLDFLLHFDSFQLHVLLQNHYHMDPVEKLNKENLRPNEL